MSVVVVTEEVAAFVFSPKRRTYRQRLVSLCLENHGVALLSLIVYAACLSISDNDKLHPITDSDDGGDLSAVEEDIASSLGNT